MQYLVETRSGGSTYKLFDIHSMAEHYYNQNKSNNAILTVISQFMYKNNGYFFSQGDSGIVCIQSTDFQFVLKFKPKNILMVEHDEIVSAMDKYYRELELPY